MDESLFEDNSFMHTAYVGNVHKLLYLIQENGCDVNSKNSKNRTALHYAALEGNVDVINALVRSGADVMAVDCLNRTPLHVAALSQSEIVRNINILKHRTNEDVSPYNITPDDYEREKLKTILDKLVNSTEVLSDKCITLLKETEYGRHADAVEALIKAGAKVNARDEKGKNPLHVATIECNPLIVKILLKHGADYLANDNLDSTPQDDSEYYNNHYTFMNILREFTDTQDNVDDDNYYY